MPIQVKAELLRGRVIRLESWVDVTQLLQAKFKQISNKVLHNLFLNQSDDAMYMSKNFHQSLMQVARLLLKFDSL